MNRIELSSCRIFIECRNNGTLCYTVHIGGQLHDAVARAREWFKKWAGDESPTVSKEVEALMQGSDLAVINLAFAKEWK